MEDPLIVPELLAPAGNLEKLETALAYGADAVYAGIERFSLRARSGCLSRMELRAACTLVERFGKRLYLTLNAFLHPEEEGEFRRMLRALRSLPISAYIIADPGALQLVREIDPDRDLHLSTQANVTNVSAAQFWQRQGVKRLNLARELSLAEITTIRERIPHLELEVFVHGALCVAYSGRCLLSAALTGRSANRGACAQSCRWNYVLQEETRPGQKFAIEEDQRGSYVFNSRDLCLIEHLPSLAAAGVDSFKIEGRMKSRYYVAAVTRVYRAALDALKADPVGWRVDPLWLSELETVSHRPYGSGFLLGRNVGVHDKDSRYRQSRQFVGVVRDDGGPAGWLVEGRNRFAIGDDLEVIGPGMRMACFRLEQAHTEAGEPVGVIQPNALVRLALPQGCRSGDLLRCRCQDN